MLHWTHPDARGLYERPDAAPPRPMPHGANDLSARVARLEEHSGFSHWDRQRIERESQSRAKDITSALQSLDKRQTQAEADLLHLKAEWKRVRRATTRLLGLGSRSLRYAAGAFLFYLVATGKVTVEQVKPFLIGMGFPSG